MDAVVDVLVDALAGAAVDVLQVRCVTTVATATSSLRRLAGTMFLPPRPVGPDPLNTLNIIIPKEEHP